MTSEKEEKEELQVAPISNVIKKMKKEYDRNPKGWRVIGSKDKDGNTVDFSNGIEIKELYYNNLATTSRYIDT